MDLKNIFKICLVIFTLSLAKSENNTKADDQFADYQISSERYLTSSNGNIMMNVNIWGHVRAPGSQIVYDGIDFASLLSTVGGPMDGANLKMVRLYREIPDSDGKIMYRINLNNFIETGNRTNFIQIKPNDTIIIPQKLSNFLYEQIGTFNAIFTLTNIIIQVINFSN
tara:strand:+ start:54085 stop:54588 length:504 start_codon:yes stop_codon:yes gene_type:complete